MKVEFWSTPFAAPKSHNINLLMELVGNYPPMPLINGKKRFAFYSLISPSKHPPKSMPLLPSAGVTPSTMSDGCRPDQPAAALAPHADLLPAPTASLPSTATTVHPHCHRPSPANRGRHRPRHRARGPFAAHRAALYPPAPPYLSHPLYPFNSQPAIAPLRRPPRSDPMRSSLPWCGRVADYCRPLHKDLAPRSRTSSSLATQGTLVATTPSPSVAGHPPVGSSILHERETERMKRKGTCGTDKWDPQVIVILFGAGCQTPILVSSNSS
jgi:hypothetical protein